MELDNVRTVSKIERDITHKQNFRDRMAALVGLDRNSNQYRQTRQRLVDNIVRAEDELRRFDGQHDRAEELVEQAERDLRKLNEELKLAKNRALILSMLRAEARVQEATIEAELEGVDTDSLNLHNKEVNDDAGT